MVSLLTGCTATRVTSFGSSLSSNSAKRSKESYMPICCSDLNCGFSKTDVCRNSSVPCSAEFLPLCSRVNVIMFSGLESGLALEEEVGSPLQHGENQFTINSSEQKKRPLVAPVIPREVGLKREGSPCSLDLAGRLNRSEIHLHYLEERDEGILSKRILSLSRSNKVRSAIELYESMEVFGLRPSAHAANSLLSCLTRNGLLSDAFRIFEMMSKNEVATGHTYSLIFKAVGSTQGCDKALEMFKALEEEGVSQKKFDSIVYNTMISICGRAKNWVETEKIWRKLKQKGVVGTRITYDLLVSTFVQCSQTELAIDVYRGMIQDGMKPSEDIMKALLASCTKDGNWALALNIFQNMLNSGIKPNLIAFNSMINCLGKAGKDDLAFRMYDLMKSLGHTPDVYTWNALLCALYRSNRCADALQLFDGIKSEQNSQLNAHLYNTALMSCQKLGRWDHSLQLLWQMETSGMQMSTESYNHAICACEVAREPKVALQVYRRMIHKKCIPDTFTYLSLIRACVWGSLWNELEEMLECVAPNSSLYNALLHGLCLRGKITKARKLYARMRCLGLKPDGKTRALMLQHLTNNIVGQHQLDNKKP